MCLYPRLIENRKYKSNKKNGGKIPTIVDKRALLVPIGCGKCMECKKKKAREWKVRLNEEIRHDVTGKFVTFTFNDTSLKELEKIINAKQYRKLYGYDLDNEVCKLAIS